MVRTEQLAQAALSGDALSLRSLTQDWLRENPRLTESAPPEASDATIVAIAAALVELLAQRRNEPAPDWTRSIGPVPSPIYLLKSAITMPRLRHLCETESPLPLRRRNLFAPPTFLEFV